MNGFCISYIGSKNIVEVGWYEESIKVGNCMTLHGNNLRVIE